jgi:hypothetical protein
MFLQFAEALSNTQEAPTSSLRHSDVIPAHTGKGGNVLCDPARLPRNNVGITKLIQERRFAVVHVAHDGHDGGFARPRSRLILINIPAPWMRTL